MNVLIYAFSHKTAKPLKGLIGIAFGVDGHSACALRDGAADKGDGDVLTSFCPLYGSFQARIVPSLHQRFAKHLFVFSARKINARLLLRLWCREAIIQIKFHCRRRLRCCPVFLRLIKHKAKLPRYVIIR